MMVSSTLIASALLMSMQLSGCAGNSPEEVSAKAESNIVEEVESQMVGSVSVDDDNEKPTAAEAKDDGDAISNSNGGTDVDDAEGKRSKVQILGLDDVDGDAAPRRLEYDELHADDMVEDSFFDPFAPDPSCVASDGGGDCWRPPDSTVEEEIVQVGGGDCAGLETLSWGYGGVDPDDDGRAEGECADAPGEGTDGESEGGDRKPACNAPADERTKSEDSTKCAPAKEVYVDKHWGSDVDILKMRDRLRGRRGKYWDLIEKEQEPGVANGTERNATQLPGEEDADPEKAKEKEENSSKERTKQRHSQDRLPRPPVFLLPGLASTRLVSWRHKPCPQSTLLSDIKMLDYVWLNMNLLTQMAMIDASCWSECMTLGRHQSDYDGVEDEMDSEEGKGGAKGCKLRPDEGLDSISSLAPGSISSELFVGGTNTVYAWLIQWLADNLGYDVTSLVALGYDWRLSPDKMEARDGFLTMTRKKIEAAVQSNGRPGIMVAHSMGNLVFRYFLEWLRVQMREGAYERYVRQAEQHAADSAQDGTNRRGAFWRGRALYHGAVHPGETTGAKEEDSDNGDGSSESVLDNMRWLFGLDGDGEQSNTNQKKEDEMEHGKSERSRKYPKLYELAKAEGDSEWLDWLGKHIWTYVGLSNPMLGAAGPLRSVLSGENMGLPFTDEEARGLELSFGSTSNVNPISTKMGFCDGDSIDTGTVGGERAKGSKRQNSNLACLEELVSEIELSKGKSNQTDPWKNFPALRLLLKDRVDFDSTIPMIQVKRKYCKEKESSVCNNETINFGPEDVMNGRIFDKFSQIWKEKGDPLGVKYDQLRHSWWHGNVPNILEIAPDRPHIKHVILAYGTDVPTETGYVYTKTEVMDNSTVANATTSTTTKADEFDGLPRMTEVIWEEPQGKLVSESIGKDSFSFTETILRKKKQKRRPLKINNEDAQWLHHSGDGTIPYISLMWAHTWLLHATRAMRTAETNSKSMLEGERISNPRSALDSIKVTHREKGGNQWVEGYGADPRNERDSKSNMRDTGTSHPHGTKYKPKMVRFQSSGKSRSTGMEYTTTVIEAIGVEHKETTRNYDILAAAFTDVLKNLHADYVDDYADL